MKPYRIPQLANPYIDYDMIQRHTDLPPFSDGRSHLLYIFLNQASHGQGHNSELYSLVTALAQLGLDTHENIDSPDENVRHDSMRSKQLKVLAGDYFSGWFYHLLAKSGQIELVGALSTAIADFNVGKARLYGRMRGMLLSAEQYLRHKVQLNTRLFLSFSPMIESSLTELWEMLLAEFSQCETVAAELRSGSHPVRALNGFCYWKVLETATEEERHVIQGAGLDAKEWQKLKLKSKCDSLLADKLQHSLKSIQVLLQGIKDEKLSGELGAALERLLPQVAVPGQAAVEG